MDKNSMLSKLNEEDEIRLNKIQEQLYLDIKNNVNRNLISKQQARIHIIKMRIESRNQQMTKNKN